MTIYSATSHPFGFPSRRKRKSLDILKFIVTTLRNKENKVSFIRVDEYGALTGYSEFMKTCHNINIIVQTKEGYESSLNCKREIPKRHMLISKELFYLNKVTRKNFVVLTISIPSGSPDELRIGCVVMFLNSYGMEQYLHTKTYKYGV